MVENGERNPKSWVKGAKTDVEAMRNHHCLQASISLPVSDWSCCPAAFGSTDVFTLFHTLTQYFLQHYFPNVYERSKSSL